MKNSKSIKTSGCSHKEFHKKLPDVPTKGIDAINKANSPSSRGKAPGSVRV